MHVHYGVCTEDYILSKSYYGLHCLPFTPNNIRQWQWRYTCMYTLNTPYTSLILQLVTMFLPLLKSLLRPINGWVEPTCAFRYMETTHAHRTICITFALGYTHVAFVHLCQNNDPYRKIQKRLFLDSLVIYSVRKLQKVQTNDTCILSLRKMPSKVNCAYAIKMIG